jgi:hypothetical protein
VALATNMISVGLDIERLLLMLEFDLYAKNTGVHSQVKDGPHSVPRFPVARRRQLWPQIARPNWEALKWSGSRLRPHRGMAPRCCSIFPEREYVLAAGETAAVTVQAGAIQPKVASARRSWAHQHTGCRCRSYLLERKVGPAALPVGRTGHYVFGA